ncbi:peptide deformylase [Fusibacter ferrireducens]|uniref:Peptide deformylase n=1 Tax=Fusibacter ferrireducens TaxID=2785058 RepID=A0ABR9ZSG5_9FIRM|nr:peptide deformylase [Fusibacter ferrireducens]MBF4693063.1 peptide deformylase [Fusibacter ferrireducens]
MALRTIRLYDDPILRKICREVNVVDEKIKLILDDMADTLYHTDNSAALAAPQIGILKRLVVIDFGEGLIELINPVIVETQGLQEVTEGCLSIPDKWGKLNRPHFVRVSAQNRHGETFEIKGEGFLAKCLCHEIDHLEGILFIDKVTKFID